MFTWHACQKVVLHAVWLQVKLLCAACIQIAGMGCSIVQCQGSAKSL